VLVAGGLGAGAHELERAGASKGVLEGGWACGGWVACLAEQSLGAGELGRRGGVLGGRARRGLGARRE
jgi:hypothetical protein